jgi:hypothetical protein
MNYRPLVTGALLLAIVLVFAIGASWAVGAAYSDTPDATETVTNESLTAQIDTWQQVDSPNYTRSFYDNETVYNSSGAALTEGSDYEWLTSNGSVYFNSSGSVSSGDDVTISYAYTAPPETARQLKSVIKLPIQVLFPFGALIIVALAVAGFAIAIRNWVGSSPTARNFGRG